MATIKTRFNLGETVVYIDHSYTAKEAEVTGMDIGIGFKDGYTTIRYFLSDKTQFLECDLFKNKTEAKSYCKKKFKTLLANI